MLARDANETVRAELAAKVATLTAPEGRSAQEKAQRFVEQTLELLARDQATRVRQILAEALKSVAGAPPAVIRQLARDAADVVACPVLEFSPLLTLGRAACRERVGPLVSFSVVAVSIKKNKTQ